MQINTYLNLRGEGIGKIKIQPVLEHLTIIKWKSTLQDQNFNVDNGN